MRRRAARNAGLRDGARLPCCVFAGVVVCLPLSPALADVPAYQTRSTFGEVGILDMPSARMAPEGQLSFTIGVLNTSQRYNLGFQILPWLEASLRYSRISHIYTLDALFDRSFGMKMRLSREDDVLPEVSLGIRDILGTGAYASEYIVASKRLGDVDLTAGFGWGRLAGVDTFANPLGLIFSSFKNRNSQFNTGQVNYGEFFHGPSMGLFGGAVWRTPIDNLNLMVEYSSDDYRQEVLAGHFKVNMPVNIGASYRIYDSLILSAGWYYGSSYGVTLTTNVDPTVNISPMHIAPLLPAPRIRTPKEQMGALTMLLRRDYPGGKAGINSPWVYVAPARPDPNQSLRAALISEGSGVRDAEVMGHTLLVLTRNTRVRQEQCQQYARIASAFDNGVDTVAFSDSDDASGNVAICPVFHRASFQTAAEDDAPAGADALPADADPEARIRADMATQHLGVEALAIESSTAWIYYTNRTYANDTEATGRIARILMADAPAPVESFHIVSVRNGLAMRDIAISRSSLERAVDAYAATFELGRAVDVTLPPLSNPILERGSSGTYPRFHWSFGPQIREGFFDPEKPLQLQLYGSATGDVELAPGLEVWARVEANIFNNFNLSRPSNSLLPHVRTDINRYFDKGINGISNLAAVWRQRITPEVFTEVKVGYLEDMFAGGGVQVLWRPEKSRFSFGADLYQVWQRDFDRLFGLQNYKILTGHVSMYYESPWYDLNLAVHAGRYLAGDYGATFEISRRFSTGVEIGAFATFTNVPFATFGEGSFDKGIYIHIPLEWAMPFFTQSSYDAQLRSLTRDGGQRLSDDDSLYGETSATSYNEIATHLDDITMP